MRTCVLDLEQIEQPDGSYDVVLCREGLMFAPDPARAAREIHRVLRPGGRVALAVWGPRERNPWLGVVLDAVSAQIGAPVPPPGVPGPFSLGDADRVAELLSGAGLADVVVDELATPLRAGSFEEWWTRTSALAGPLANMLSVAVRGSDTRPSRPPARGGPRVRNTHRPGVPRCQPPRLGAPAVTVECLGRAQPDAPPVKFHDAKCSAGHDQRGAVAVYVSPGIGVAVRPTALTFPGIRAWA